MAATRLAGLLRLPLVERELAAAANRPRTYRRRCVLLGALLGIYCMVHLSVSAERPSGALQLLGTGYVFNATLLIACAALTASAVLSQSAATIAAEKEGGTLPLLLLTPLGARRLAVQKWLSQLVDAGTLPLLAVPFLAIGYTFGGIGAAKVAAYAIALAQLIMQAGAAGVLASCLCGTARGAGAMALLLALAGCAATLGAGALLEGMAPVPGSGELALACFALTPVGVLVMAADSRAIALSLPWLWWIVACALPLVPVALMLRWAGSALARWRERPAPTDAQGRMAVARPERTDLPQLRGVAWLAWRQGFLGRQWFRLLLPLVVGLLLLGDAMACTVADGGGLGRLIALALFAIGTVVLCSSCGGALPYERQRQTLEVMLTTPRSSEGMVAELYHLNRRVMRWILAALAIAVAFVALQPGGMLHGIETAQGGGLSSALRCAALVLVALASLRNCLAFILPCGLLVGSTMASSANARATTLVHTLFFLVLAPLLVFLLVLLVSMLGGMFGDGSIRDERWMSLAQAASACISPLTIAWVCLVAPVRIGDLAGLPLLLALPIFHAAVLAWLDRRMCARAAARLRRPASAATQG